jgi:hypothetical protein
MDKITIILRTCDKMEKFSSPQQQVPRPFGTKKEIIKKCFDSLIESIELCSAMNVNVELRIVDDHSSQETKDYLTSRTSKKIWELSKTGNGESLKACYELARDECDGAIFFIEDDYLFEKSAIYECYMAQKDFGSTNPVIIHPVDYIDRYTKKYPSYICLGRSRHWRTIQHTTGTFLITKEILLDQWNNYMEFTELGLKPGVSEDTSINKIYKKYNCFSPMPTLAEHYQENWTLSPYSRLKNE